MPRKADPALADSRRKEILDAAARCFVRRGLHATTMREILAEAGLSTGAVYSYFDSKEAIIEAMAARERGEIDELAAYLETTKDARRAITDAVVAIVRDCTRDAARLGVELLAEASRNDRVKAAIEANDRALREAFQSKIRQGQSTGEIPADPPADLLLETIVAIYEGFMGRIAFDVDANPARFAKAAEDILDRLFAGPS